MGTSRLPGLAIRDLGLYDVVCAVFRCHSESLTFRITLSNHPPGPSDPVNRDSRGDRPSLLCSGLIRNAKTRKLALDIGL